MEGGSDSSKFNVVVNDILGAPNSFGTSPAIGTNTPPSSSNNNKGKGKQPTNNNDSSSPVPKSVASLGRPPLPPSSPASKPREQANNWQLPTSNITRMMRSILPPYAKISDEAKDTVQECLVEFICFITEEASAQCQREHRKTITADDLLASMSRLGFDNYIDPLNLYLRKYRVSEGLDPHRPSRLHHQLSFTRPTINIVGPTLMPNARFPPRASHASTSITPATPVMSSLSSVGQHMFGPNYRPAPNTRVGFGAYHDSTAYTTIPSSNVPGSNYPTPNTGVGFGGASHGHNGPINTLAATPKGSMVGANEYEYGFGPVYNMCCDAGSSNNNVGMFEFNGEFGDANNLPSFPNSSASDGGVGGSQCFNPFDHFK